MEDFTGIVQPFDSSLFHISQTQDSGNGLIATRAISKGELLFKETPFIQNWDKNSVLAHERCSQCGVYMTPDRDISLCSSLCGCSYCSESCNITAISNGHQWLCAAYTNGGVIDQLSCTDTQGHIILALKVYAKVAQTMLEHPSFSGLISIALILNNIQQADYCRTAHAFRSGLGPIDETLFETLIAPAYYDSYLAEPLNLFKSIFESPSARVQWEAGDMGKDMASKRCAEFLESELFSDGQVLRQVVGMFVTNNLETSVLRPEGGSEAASGGTSEELSPHSLRGTALYKIYSKMNHSCECNTENRGSSSGEHGAEVSVYAARDIAAGEEIMTSYLHMTNPRTVSRKFRQEALQQYLFECKCALCTGPRNELVSSSDSESDY